MIFDSLHSDVMYNRALLWLVLAHVTESFALAVVFAACALWCLLTAFMGVDA